MQKSKYFPCFYHSVLFFCSKRKKLQNIAIYHSGDNDYNDFVKIYREYKKEPFNFSTIDTTLPATDPLRFRKDLLLIYKNDSN